MEAKEKIPFSIEAEKYIIGCLFIEPEIVGEVLNRVGPEDFYVRENKNIMQAISHLYSNEGQVEQVKVLDELKRRNLLEASGGTNYLYNIIEEVPSVADVSSYLEIIEEKSLLRELYYATSEIGSSILDGSDPFYLIGEKAQKRLNQIVDRRRTSDIKKIHRFTNQVLDIIEANKSTEGKIIGLDTGFEELNKLTFGFQKGELIILAARPGIGKSALALNIASNACRNRNANVAFFSLEMGVDQLTMRLFSSFSGLSLTKIRSGKLNATEMTTLLAAKSAVDRLNLYIDETSNTNLIDIKAKCLKLKRENKLDFIVVDYLQLIQVPRFKGNRVEEVGQISRGLKLMARELDVPVLALSQLSRSAEENGGRPALAHLRESGSIEQDADIVMFLFREQTIKGADEMNMKRASNHNTELIIAKNRQGATDTIPLLFKGAQSIFIPKD
ncbi:MAG: replicative DNA helicase [Bacilli bacterium]|jgi:replicative DNA helicase|nr:replicative DNA helicase [Bacilli bacterium]MDY0064351.1 replicative DNA helicase [Bacilli bacterium]